MVRHPAAAGASVATALISAPDHNTPRAEPKSNNGKLGNWVPNPDHFLDESQRGGIHGLRPTYFSKELKTKSNKKTDWAGLARACTSFTPRALHAVCGDFSAPAQSLFLFVRRTPMN